MFIQVNQGVIECAMVGGGQSFASALMANWGSGCSGGVDEIVMENKQLAGLQSKTGVTAAVVVTELDFKDTRSERFDNRPDLSPDQAPGRLVFQNRHNIERLDLHHALSLQNVATGQSWEFLTTQHDPPAAHRPFARRASYLKV
jgi:hypothetical protein